MQLRKQLSSLQTGEQPYCGESEMSSRRLIHKRTLCDTADVLGEVTFSHAAKNDAHFKEAQRHAYEERIQSSIKPLIEQLNRQLEGVESTVEKRAQRLVNSQRIRSERAATSIGRKFRLSQDTSMGLISVQRALLDSQQMISRNPYADFSEKNKKANSRFSTLEASSKEGSSLMQRSRRDIRVQQSVYGSIPSSQQKTMRVNSMLNQSNAKNNQSKAILCYRQNT